MTRLHGPYEIDDDFERIDLRRVHSWLTGTYWSPGVSFERVERAAKHSSMVIGAYLGSEQVGYARVVSDRATFSWIADVYVDESNRGKGIGRTMVRFAMEHPEFVPMRRWVLATKDAHGVYAELGFSPVERPENWLIVRGEAAEAGSP